MSSYARANVRITNAENKRQIPMRASRGLKSENKTYKLKRSIDNQTSKFTRPLENVLAPFYKNLKGGLAVHFYERKSKEQSIFDHV